MGKNPLPTKACESMSNQPAPTSSPIMSEHEIERLRRAATDRRDHHSNWWRQRMVVELALYTGAKAAELSARAEAGEEIVIARRNKPAVKLVPVDAAPKKRRVPGAFAHLRDRLKDVDWFEPLPEDELRAWEGTLSKPSHHEE